MARITGVNSQSQILTNQTTNSLINSSIPVGSIILYANDSIPSSPNNLNLTYFICNGASLNTFTFRELHAVISNNYGGTAFQNGVTNISSAATTFNLPDFTNTPRHPLGASPSILTPTDISTPGKTGGSFNHIHQSTTHQHSFVHSHGLRSHTHNTSHSHGMRSHTHTCNHGHTQQIGHYHWIPQHKHTGVDNVTYTHSNTHTHNIYVTTVTSGVAGSEAGTKVPRAADPNSGTFVSGGTWDLIGAVEDLSLASMSVGNAVFGWNMSTSGNATDTGAVQLTVGSTSNQNTEPSNINDTDSVSKVSSSTAQTSSESTANTDPGGGGINTTNNTNPPYLPINFLIRYSSTGA